MAYKIMLVEDDNNLRAIYGDRLLAEGYEIVSARDGEEALAMAVKEKPHLIISDVMMPKISGFDMLDILRSTPETKDVKVIMMTALSQAEDKERASKLGADKYLVKSQVTLEDVARVVHEVLGDGSLPGQENPSETAPASAAPAMEVATPPAPEPAPQATSNPFEAPMPAAPVAPPAPEPTQQVNPVVTEPVVAPAPAFSPEPQPEVAVAPAPQIQPAPTMDPVLSTTTVADDTTPQPVAVAPSNDPQPVMSPDPMTPQPQAQATPVTDEPSSPVDDSNSIGGVKKVIQPINDLSQDTQPKIYELYEKELAQQQTTDSIINPTVQAPTMPVTPDAQQTAETLPVQPTTPVVPQPAPNIIQPAPPQDDPNNVAL